MLKVADKIKSDSKKYPCEFQIFQEAENPRIKAKICKVTFNAYLIATLIKTFYKAKVLLTP